MLLGFCFGECKQNCKKNNEVPSQKVLGLKSLADRADSDSTALPDLERHVVSNYGDTI